MWVCPLLLTLLPFCLFFAGNDCNQTILQSQFLTLFLFPSLLTFSIHSIWLTHRHWKRPTVSFAWLMIIIWRIHLSPPLPLPLSFPPATSERFKLAFYVSFLSFSLFLLVNGHLVATIITQEPTYQGAMSVCLPHKEAHPWSVLCSGNVDNNSNCISSSLNQK